MFGMVRNRPIVQRCANIGQFLRRSAMRLCNVSDRARAKRKWSCDAPDTGIAAEVAKPLSAV